MARVPPVPLSGDWLKEREGITGSGMVAFLLRQMTAFLHTADVLAERLGQRRLKVKDLQLIQGISLQFFAHSTHVAQSIYRLARQGYGIGCLILTRTLIEALIDLNYLWQCKRINGNDTDEREAWVDYHSVQISKIARAWYDIDQRLVQRARSSREQDYRVDQSLAETWDEQRGEFKARYERDHWARYEDLRTRAIKADRVNDLSNGFLLQEMYDKAYRWLSGFVHPSASASPGLMVERDDAWHVEFGPSGRFVDTALGAACHAFLHLLGVVNHLNHFDVDMLAQLRASGLEEVND